MAKRLTRLIDKLSLAHSWLSVLSGVLLGRQEVDITVERELPVLVEPGRNTGHLGYRNAVSSLGEINDHPTDVVNLGRLHSNQAQKPFQDQFGGLLSLSDGVRIGLFFEEQTQRFRTNFGLPKVRLGK